jgi:uncharacterized protein GlcG (DUF336 family)
MESLTLECAQQLVAGAIAKAKADFSAPICVSVCDESRFLVAFARMEGAPLRSTEISQNKAVTAIHMGVATDKFQGRIEHIRRDASCFGERMLPLHGGNLITGPKGKLLGAIGVSGLARSEDQSITEAPTKAE